MITMKKNFKAFLSILISSAILLSVTFTASGICVRDYDRDAYTAEDSEKTEYLQFFNDSVNSLKTELPYAKMVYTAGIPENGLTNVSEDGSQPLNATAQKFIDTFFDGIFNRNSSAFKSLMQTLLGAESVKQDSFELHRGAKRNSIVPVYGEDYVSALTDAGDYELTLSQESGKEYPSEISIAFSDVAIADAGESSLPAVFTLPSGSIDARLINGTDDDTASFLESVKLEDLTFKDAGVVAKYGEDGKLTYYGTVISYDFSFSYFEAIKLLDAILGVDIYTATVETMNTIVMNLGRDDISAETVLESRRMHIVYTVKTEITDIDFTPRYFGDVDDNGGVTSADARVALRHAVGIADITATEDLMYADVNFDGEINSVDARQILRTAVGLEEKFSEIPEGSTVKIIVIEQDHTGEDKDSSDDGDDEGQEFGGLIDLDTDTSAAEIVQSVFDTINSFKNAENSAVNGIQGFIEIIKSLTD